MMQFEDAVCERGVTVVSIVLCMSCELWLRVCILLNIMRVWCGMRVVER